MSFTDQCSARQRPNGLAGTLRMHWQQESIVYALCNVCEGERSVYQLDGMGHQMSSRKRTLKISYIAISRRPGLALEHSGV